MEWSTQVRRAKEFRDMHRGELLVLPNAWDVVSAKLYEVQGFRAVGTTSAGISSALGFADGEQMPLEANLGVCRRMIDHLAVPVSVDLEAGYGSSLDGLAETIAKVIAAGAVGVNLEDSAKAGCGGHGAGTLLAPSAQADRIAAARSEADRAGVPLVINARTDVFLLGHPVTRERLDEAIERGNAYRRAGADCVFVPDMGELTDAEIEALVDGIDAPLNLVAGERTPCVERLEALGVARLSFGPRPMRAALQFVREMASEWLVSGTYDRMTAKSGLSYDEVNGWFARPARKSEPGRGAAQAVAR
jgi:2-methylisocitrate lyase-like PEP mutase family enzyme